MAKGNAFSTWVTITVDIEWRLVAALVVLALALLLK
jgi:hypothetical protein